MRLYLDNCCFNRPFDDQSTLTIRLETEAEQEKFDYTQWRQPLFAELSGEEISHRAMEYQRRKRGAVALVEDKVSDR